MRALYTGGLWRFCLVTCGLRLQGLHHVTVFIPGWRLYRQLAWGLSAMLHCWTCYSIRALTHRAGAADAQDSTCAASSWEDCACVTLRRQPCQNAKAWMRSADTGKRRSRSSRLAATHAMPAASVSLWAAAWTFEGAIQPRLAAPS